MTTMKLPLIFIYLMFTSMLLGCASSVQRVAQSKAERKILTDFLEDFENAVKNHDQESIMTFLDSAYVVEQHDQMLEGRSDQFINELLCGNNLNTGAFTCPELLNIQQIRVRKIEVTEDGEYRVYFDIAYLGDIIQTDLFLKRIAKNELIKFSFIGAVG